MCAVLLVFTCSPAVGGQHAGVLRAARYSTQRDVYYTVSKGNSKAHCLPFGVNLQHTVILQIGFQQCCMTCDIMLCQAGYQLYVQRAGSRVPSAAAVGMALI
jgi:hypothetical protein